MAKLLRYVIALTRGGFNVKIMNRKLPGPFQGPGSSPK